MGWNRLYSLKSEILKKVVLALALVLSPIMSTSTVIAQQSAPTGAAQLPVISQITVIGNERVEPETIASYLSVRVGDRFDPARLDDSLKSLFSTGLFADVKLSADGTTLVIRVLENPIINRVIFEGNKKLDREDMFEEVRIRPRTVFTRAKVRADVERIMGLYRTSGRFAAIIEPKVVQQDQNRVDVIFEIQEGPKTKVSSIKFIGNHKYSDTELRDIMATKQARWWKIFSSNDTFDPDRMAYDQQQVRQFYLNEGYADFRIVSAVAELTPDREDFFMIFTIEEGEIYKFGKVDVTSEIRDVDADLFQSFVYMEEGEYYNAEQIENTIESLTNAAGLLGYAFVDVRPSINRDREGRVMTVTFNILEAPRVYVERINIHGNIRTLDRVIRREFRLQEGDAFNSALVSRSENRLQRLNFFREVEVDRQQGSQPDRMVIDVSVEEQATGELNLGAGFSSVENFMLDFSISERNVMGKGQNVNLSTRLSKFSQSINLGFTEPYFLNRNIAAGGDIFMRRNNGGLNGNGFNTKSKGFSVRLGAALGEYWTLQSRYTLKFDNIFVSEKSLDIRLGYLECELSRGYQYKNCVAAEPDPAVILLYDTNGDGVLSIEEKSANQLSYFDDIMRDNLGSKTQSILGYTFGFDTRNSIIRPTGGRAFYVNQDFAGLGGDVKYIRTRVNFDNYWTPFEGWTLRLSAEAGLIKGIGQNVKSNDKFYLGGPRLRGFANSAVGPRRPSFFRPQLGGMTDEDYAAQTASDLLRYAPEIRGQALGGTKQYISRAEVFFPLGDAALEMGINASAFADVGSLWGADVSKYDLGKCDFGESEFTEFHNAYNTAISEGAEPPTFGHVTDCVIGDSMSPRASIGIGFSWQSPFGPFRIDLTKALRSQFGDRTQTLQFNIGTTF